MSCNGVGRVKPAFSSEISDLVAYLRIACEQNGVSRIKIFNQLLEDFDLESTGVIRYKKLRVELSDDIIQELKNKEEIKATAIAKYCAKSRAIKAKDIKVTSMDKNAAQCIIIEALMSFECYKANKCLKKKDIVEYFGYKERTMRFQNHKLKDDLTKNGNIYNQIYSELRSEIENLIGK